MKKLILCLTGLVAWSFIGTTATAQDTFEEWKKKQMQEFQDFKDKRDKEFMKYLEDAWKAIESQDPVNQYEEPKPDKLPSAESEPDNEIKQGPKVKSRAIPEPEREEEPDLTDLEVPEPKQEKEDQQYEPEPQKEEPAPTFNKKNFSFYEVPIGFKYDPAFDTTLSGKIEKKSISAYWRHMSGTNYEVPVEQTKAFRKELSLNDWGYARLVHQLGEQIYGANSNESVLYTWFIMTKSNFSVKVGYNDDGVYLLLPTKNQVFNTPYFTIDDKKFYVIALEEGDRQPTNLYTYDGSYPGAQADLDLSIQSVPKIKHDMKNKKLSFTYEGEEYTVPVKYNMNIVEFYKNFPQTDLEIFFDASVSPEAETSMLKGLQPIIEDKSEVEAVNIILRFVQTAFDYKVDDAQFGREKYLLPEETIYYPYSDCEDRCILFAYLVRNLTDLKVVGLRYPGHLATAVQFSDPPKGNSVSYNGSTYTMADPTYKNADIGMTMPKFEDEKPKVITLK